MARKLTPEQKARESHRQATETLRLQTSDSEFLGLERERAIGRARTAEHARMAGALTRASLVLGMTQQQIELIALAEVRIADAKDGAIEALPAHDEDNAANT